MVQKKLLVLVGVLTSLHVSLANGQLATQGEDLPAYYNVKTGNLTIDTTNVIGGISIGYGIEPGVFRSENFTPFMDSPFLTAKPDSVGETNFEGVAGGIYSLGDILLPGLTEAELIETYFGANSRGQPSGQGGGGERTFKVIGGLGENSFHILKPVYSPSPFPPQNDPDGLIDPVDRWASAATISYDARDGSVTLDTTGDSGGAIWLYELALTEPSFELNAFRPAVTNLRPSARVDTIVETGFGWIDEGVYPLGAILPAGLNDSELGSLVERFQFVGQPGHSVTSLDISRSGVPLSILVVPEPRTEAGLFVVALLFLVKCRR